MERGLHVAFGEDQHQHHAAPPKLYGAPAYARPPATVAESQRPFDPDDLPITASQTTEEREWVEALPARAYAPGGGVMVANRDDEPAPADIPLQPRPFLLRALAGRILGSD
jgi:hypothetical protein